MFTKVFGFKEKGEFNFFSKGYSALMCKNLSRIPTIFRKHSDINKKYIMIISGENL